MKKYILTILAIGGLFGASCSNDSIQVDSDEYVPEYTLSVNVNTAPTYEAFGIDEYKSDYLGSGDSYCIGVYTLAYDKDGNFADSVFSSIKTFQPLEQRLTLKEGSYTIITIEMLVNVFDCMSPYWDLNDIDRLSTVKIEGKEEYYKYFNRVFLSDAVVGVTARTVPVQSNQNVDVSPSVVGSLIDTHFLNFDQSEYNFAGFYTKNQPAGLYLNPILSGDAQYYYNSYTPKHSWYSRSIAFIKEGILAAHVNQKVYMLESGNVQCGFGPSTYTEEDGVSGFHMYPDNNTYFNFEKGKTYYLGLGFVGGSEECSTYMGDRAGYNTWSTTLPLPNSVLFKEPYTTWGEAVSSVKNYMSDFTLSRDIQLGSNGLYYISYHGKDNVLYYEYDFKTSTSGLNRVYVCLNHNKVRYESIDSYLRKCGYTYVLYSVEDKNYTYMKDSTLVFVFLDNDGDWIVSYINAKEDEELYMAPYTTWGGSVAAVKSYMSAYKLSNDIKLGSDGLYWMSYEGKGNVYFYEYDFRTDTSGLERAYICLNHANVTYNDIKTYMEGKGYEYYNYDESSEAYFFSGNQTIIIIYQDSDSDWVVEYIYKADSSTPSKIRANESHLVIKKRNIEAGVRSQVLPPSNMLIKR